MLDNLDSEAVSGKMIAEKKAEADATVESTSRDESCLLNLCIGCLSYSTNHFQYQHGGFLMIVAHRSFLRTLGLVLLNIGCIPKSF